ncbi:phenylalanine--tRNA ligase subunit beta [Tunturiibacter empetritectus]|uniref:phenylalanine--tRNA ligase n=1 Tax=Tunturiibacter lichenicola TaxID=2051959 RepID=A0A852VHJ2_9BACT|nr:phenylalanine--tRNA ligase subunit beta [Edaphobacter lichenicola]NYF92278.1 phenylalanyl-tRNA synthetase beta subunit [Edaphobacter lichenicola]
MNIITPWLRTYVPNIPVDDHQLAEALTLRGIAVEGIHSLGASANGKSNGHLFEMDITTNRVDAMNHYGIAREAATIYNLPLAPLNPKLPIGTLVDAPFSVRIAPEAKGLCGRFTAQVIRNVTIAPSSAQVADYFTLLGQKQISNAVDASNFVLLGMGHPTHAFDLDKIAGGIIVRLAHKGEKLKLLDGTDRTLEADDLVVADEKKALALAGVMGGWDSMITPETKNILVEAAWFDPATVRRSGRRHGLHTDASHRFERGADFNAAPIANALVTQLILNSGVAQSGGGASQQNGKPEGELIDLIDPEVAARTANRPPIDLSVKQVQRHLGQTIAPHGITSEIVAQYLTSLGCELLLHGLRDDQAVYSTKLPSWRLDLEREIDLIEEVARVYGYNRFANTLPAPGVVLTQPTHAKEAAVRTRLLALGFSESISSTFASQQDSDLFYAATGPAQKTDEESSVKEPEAKEPETKELEAKELGAPSFAVSSQRVGYSQSEPSSSNIATNSSPNPGAPHVAASPSRVGHRDSDPPSPTAATIPVPMENPLSEEASLLRPSLVPGMVTMLAHNLNRDVREVRLFEQGQIFTGTIPADGAFISDVHEIPQLSLGLTTASPQPTAPLQVAADAPFFELKGAIESLLSLFDLNAARDAFPPRALASEKESSSRPEAALLPPERRDPRISSAQSLTFTPEAPAWLQPGRSATALVNNRPIAHFGELVHTQKEARKLRQPLYLAQLNLAALYELPLKKITAHDLSRYQAVERDFSFVFPDATQWQTVSDAIHALAIPELQSLKPIEVWRDQKKYPGVYSLLLRTVFQSNDRTLREDELTNRWTRIIAALTALGGTIRDGANETSK